MSPKSKRTDFLLCLLLGVFGAHRFYEGKIATGVAYALTLGAFGMGAIADLLQIAFGVRTDKQKRQIGKPSRLPHLVVRIGAVIVAAVVVVGSVVGWWNHAATAPVVAEDYYEHVDVNLPIESKFTALGPLRYEGASSAADDEAFSEYKMWFPSAVDQRANEQFPAVVVANGSGTPFFRYEPVLQHLASWGFIVIASDDESSGDGRSSALALDQLLRMNADASSRFYDKIDVEHIGVAGHSQGGAAAINAATNYANSDRFTSLFVASTTSLSLIKAVEFTSWTYDTSRLQIPYFAVAGTGDADAETIAPLGSMIDNYNHLPQGVPAIMARRNGADHGEMLTWADGYMTAWFRFTLMGDEDAQHAFVGPTPEIESNQSWRDVHRKSLD